MAKQISPQETQLEQQFAHPPSPSDDVYPLYPLDRNVAKCNLTLLMRFSDILDANKLHLALDRLLEIGDWKKLSGRLRLDPNGLLALHVPHIITPERPAVAYTHTTFDVNLEDHPLAKDLPRITKELSLQFSIHRVSSFWADIFPVKFDEYLHSDIPPLALHITTFKNATLVALDFPHCLTDIMGSQSLLKAWSKVLAGAEEEVPPLYGAREDATKPIWDVEEAEDDEPWALSSKFLTGWKLISLVFQTVFRILLYRKVESRTLCLPESFVKDLRKRANEDLRGCDFVSDSDIISAWTTSLIARSHKWTRKVSLLGMIDVRSRLPSVFTEGAAYMQNLGIWSYNSFHGPDLISGSLGSAASSIRQSLKEQTTEPQIRAGFRKFIQLSLNRPLFPIIAEPDSLLIFISDWSKAKFVETVDFSPALVQIGDPERPYGNAPGRMLYLLGGFLHLGPKAQNGVFVMGKDCGGNYWVTLTVAVERLRVIEGLINNPEFLKGSI